MTIRIAERGLEGNVRADSWKVKERNGALLNVGSEENEAITKPGKQHYNSIIVSERIRRDAEPSRVGHAERDTSLTSKQGGKKRTSHGDSLKGDDLGLGTGKSLGLYGRL